MLAHDNPFRTTKIDQQPHSFCGQPLQFYIRQLEALGRKAAIIGQHGVGKSTLLLAMYQHYRLAGHPTAHLRGCGLDNKRSIKSYWYHLRLVGKVIQRRGQIIFFDGLDALPSHLNLYKAWLSPLTKLSASQLS
jgi:hypothetical protein